MSELTGRVALVTGGGSGIGFAAAKALAGAGAKVALMGRDAGRVGGAVRELGADNACAVQGDVGSEDDVSRAVQAVLARFGRLDIAVNSAGTGSIAALVDQRGDEWEQTLRTNLTGAMHCIKHQAAAMVQAGHGGSIVNVSSIAGALTHRLMSAYCVSKAGLEMLTRCAADELGEHRVRVNALRPGLVPTDLSRILADHPKVRANYESQMPLQRLGTSEEVAEAILFLASDRSSWITGQVLSVDGGHTLRGGPDVGLLLR
jgi:NAD(P)-dependent dehydrogenase (short-subunit alcohol dehydrogenase family)